MEKSTTIHEKESCQRNQSIFEDIFQLKTQSFSILDICRFDANNIQIIYSTRVKTLYSLSQKHIYIIKICVLCVEISNYIPMFSPDHFNS